MADTPISVYNRDEISDSTNGWLYIFTVVGGTPSDGEKISVKNLLSTPELLAAGVSNWQSLLKLAIKSDSIGNLAGASALTQTPSNGVYKTDATTTGLSGDYPLTGLLEVYNDGTKKYLRYSTFDTDHIEVLTNYYDGTDWNGWQVVSDSITATQILEKIGDGSLIDAAYLPSYVDDVIEAADFASLPGTGETGKIYVTLDDSASYRWTGTVYVNISNPLDYASEAEADAGTENTKVMTALRVLQSFVYQIANYTVSALNTTAKTIVGSINELFAKFVDYFNNRGNFDASGDTWPTTGGSGTSGAIKKNDRFRISTGGAPGGVTLIEGNEIWALVDTPGQTVGNWAVSVGGAPPASGVSFTPSTNIVSTDIQAALEEIDVKQMAFTTTATTGGTTTLTAASTANQFFTGTNIQAIRLPNTTTLTNGRKFYIKNKSTSIISIHLSDGSYLLRILKYNEYAVCTCINNGSNVYASWQIEVHTLKFIEVVLGQKDTDISADTDIADFVINEAFRAVDIYTYAFTPGTGSTTIYDVNLVGGSSILGTRIIAADGGNKSASGVFSSPEFIGTYNAFTVDCDQNGATTKEKNTMLILEYYSYLTPQASGG